MERMDENELIIKSTTKLKTKLKIKFKLIKYLRVAVKPFISSHVMWFINLLIYQSLSPILILIFIFILILVLIINIYTSNPNISNTLKLKN